MTLTTIEPGRFSLQGEVTFDNASEVESQGRDLLNTTLRQNVDRLEISLHALGHADSSALSVCLSWVRLARSHQMRLCFTDIPRELHALATVCGISAILNNVSSPS